MVALKFRQIIALSVAGSMFVSTTSAVAATPAAAPVQQIDPWAALSVMSAGAPAAALCGSAAVTAAAAQGTSGCVLPAVDAPPPVAEHGPPPPVPVPPIAAPSSFNLGVSPLLLALGAVAAGAALYFLVIKKKHSSSPA